MDQRGNRRSSWKEESSQSRISVNVQFFSDAVKLRNILSYKLFNMYQDRTENCISNKAEFFIIPKDAFQGKWLEYL